MATVSSLDIPLLQAYRTARDAGQFAHMLAVEQLINALLPENALEKAGIERPNPEIIPQEAWEQAGVQHP